MTRYVITSGHPSLHGTIGHWERYDSVGVVLGFKDEKGFLSSCSFPLDTVRELDDTPIAAGDEVVCVEMKGCDITPGKSYIVDRESGGGESVFIRDDSGDVYAHWKSRFAKVRPLEKREAAPTVEAQTEKYFVLLVADHEWVARDSRTDAMHYAHECAKGGAKTIVYKPVSIAEPAEPVITTLE